MADKKLKFPDTIVVGLEEFSDEDPNLAAYVDADDADANDARSDGFAIYKLVNRIEITRTVTVTPLKAEE